MTNGRKMRMNDRIRSMYRNRHCPVEPAAARTGIGPYGKLCRPGRQFADRAADGIDGVQGGNASARAIFSCSSRLEL